MYIGACYLLVIQRILIMYVSKDCEYVALQRRNINFEVTLTTWKISDHLYLLFHISVNSLHVTLLLQMIVFKSIKIIFVPKMY